MADTRRNFILTSAALAEAAAQSSNTERGEKYSANDRIQIATIGVGGMGSGDTRYQLSLPGVELVGVCDIYDGRLERAKEVWGKQIFTTRDYRELLSRKEIDAVIVATPDHWHSRITIDALNAGKDVYCEKPMVQKIEQAKPVIDAVRKSGRIMQVGSQYVSSLIYQKTRELIQSGAVGEVNMVEAWLDRNTAIGAWQYSIPPDASPSTIDWDRFLGSAPKRPFEATRLFRWRNYRDYGTGVAGDLFVHLLSGLHFATGSIGPTRVFATGGLRYWKDGREVPDVMLAMLDYPAGPHHPAFNLVLRVNLKSSVATEQFGFRFVGSEGILLANSSVTLSKVPPEVEPGYTIGTFPNSVQEEFLRRYRTKYPPVHPIADGMRPQEDAKYSPPPGYSAQLEHHRNFIASVRSRKPVVEDAIFGLRAAGPALLTNTSYYESRLCLWDPQMMIAN